MEVGPLISIAPSRICHTRGPGGSGEPPLPANPVVAQRIGARLEIFAWAFATNRPHKISQLAAAQPRLVAKFRHEIAAMPFHPADFVFVKLALPARRRFRTDLGKVDPCRSVA